MHIDTQRELVARVSTHLANGTTDSVPYNLRVTAAHYTDDGQAALEIEQLFRREPLLVALTPDLPSPGDYLTHEAAGTSLLLVRDQDGRARCYINACRHRGVRVAEGRGRARSFSCPFHAWNWRLDGSLAGRPNSNGGFDAVDAACNQLYERPCLELAGLIFVLLEGDDIEQQVRAKLGGALDDIAHYRIADTVYFDSRETERNCNYKFIVDGFCESYHIAALHKDTISPFYYTTPALCDLLGRTVRMIGVRRSIDREFDKPADERRLLRHGTTQYLIPPNIVLTHQVDHIQFWRVYPLGSAGRCRVEFSLYWPQPMDDDARRKSRFNVDVIWDVVTGEDFPQGLAIHRNLASGAVPELIFGRNEPALAHYHEGIARAIGSDRLTRL